MKDTTKYLIIKKMTEEDYITEDISELSKWINNNVPGVETAINMPYMSAKLHNLHIINEPEEQTAEEIFENLDICYGENADIAAYLKFCKEIWLTDNSYVFMYFEDSEDWFCMKKEEYNYLDQDNYADWFKKKYEE